MGQMDSYKSNCDYIRKNFSLPENTDLYTLVNRITESYKDLKDQKLLVELSNQAEQPLKQEKKRGRPRKR